MPWGESALYLGSCDLDVAQQGCLKVLYQLSVVEWLTGAYTTRNAPAPADCDEIAARQITSGNTFNNTVNVRARPRDQSYGKYMSGIIK